MLIQAVSWEATLPNYGHYPFFAKSMKTFLSVGSNVVIKTKSEADKKLLSEFGLDGTVVATILSYSSEDEITCVIYQHTELLQPCCNPPLPLMSGPSYGLKEIVKTRNKVVVSANDIVDHAFVFTIIDVEADVINHYGITNCYLLRYQFDNNTKEDIEHHVKFPCESMGYPFIQRTLAAKIWYGITRIQDALWKVMNSESERQITIVRVPLVIDDETLDYIAYRCGDEVKKITINTKGRKRCITTKGLKRKAGRARNNLSILRFETEAQLVTLRKIIGKTTTVGIRRRRPKIGTTDQLELNNTINLIVGKNNNNNQQPALTTQRYIRHESIDLVVDANDKFMIVRYDSYNYNRKGVTNESSDLSENAYVVEILSGIAEVRCNNQYVRIGHLLSRDNVMLLRVTSVLTNHAVLECIAPAEIAGESFIENDLILLEREIRAYNS